MLRLARLWEASTLEALWREAGLLRAVHEPPARVAFLSWDSRLIRPAPENLFLALSARRDGHEFIGEALRRGAVAALMQKPLAFLGWEVSDTWQALYVWAEAWRKQMPYPLLAITGGAGKTWIKEWLYQLLDPRPTERSPHSFNSRLGIPLSLLGFSCESQLGLVEVAITHPDEMPARAALVRPAWTIFTPITEIHIRQFGSVANLLSAHLPLLTQCSWILAREDERVMNQECLTELPWCWVGEGGEAHFRIEWQEGDRVRWRLPGGEIQTLGLPGDSPVARENALLAAAAAILLGAEPDEVARKLPHLSPLPHRREWLQLHEHRYLLNDSYHGDVASAIGVIEEFAQMPFQRKVVILAGLSPYTPESHRPVVETLKAHFSPQAVHLIGPEWGSCGWGKCYADVGEFLEQGRVGEEAVLLKGGHRYRLFERVLPVLVGRTVGPVLRIDLSVVQANLQRLRAELPPHTRLIAVLKAEAYGQGGSVISAFLARQGVAGAAVAFIPEGLALRKAGFTLPVWVFYPDAYGSPEPVEAGLEMAVGTWQALKTWGGRTPIHIEIDTGMGRMGFPPQELGALLEYLRGHPEVQVQGIFSHLACPEQPDEPLTRRQIEVFEGAVRTFRERYPNILASLLSTGGILTLGRKAAYDAVRVGIGLYGAVEGLTEATALYAPILRIWTTPSELRLNYGFSARVPAGSRIATVAIGYADGLLRSWAAREGARVYLRGEPARVLPPLNMDLMLIALPEGVPATEGDLVEIWGPMQPLRTFAAECETIPYEVLVRLSQRIRRIYEWGT